MRSEVPHASHRLVAVARLEAFVRFARVLQREPAAIPHVLTVFLGPQGIGHPAMVRELTHGSALSRAHPIPYPCHETKIVSSVRSDVTDPAATVSAVSRTRLSSIRGYFWTPTASSI